VAEAAPRLSIVIVTYNSRAYVGACLDALAQYSPPHRHEILVVDNASPDGTGAAIRNARSDVRVIDAGANLGFARANNLGIRASTGELILLLNPDATVTAEAVGRLVAALDVRSDAAIAGPRLLDPSGRVELSFGSMLSPWAECRQKLLLRGYERGWGPVAAYVRGLTRRPQDVDWVSGACLLVRRADAEAVGLMDERYFMYAEDVDFCAAVRGRGRRVIFVPSAEVVHLRGQSRATAAAATNVAYRRSHIAFYEKHHPGWARLLRLYLKVRGELPDSPIRE